MWGSPRVKVMVHLRGSMVAGMTVTATAVRARAWAMAAGMVQGRGESEGRETEGITYLDAGASMPQYHWQSLTSTGSWGLPSLHLTQLEQALGARSSPWYLREETLLPMVRVSTLQCSLTSRAATNLKYSIKNMLAICERMKRENIHTLYALIIVFMVEGNDGGNRGIKDGREIWKGDQEITKIYIPRLNSAPLGANAEMLKCHLFSCWRPSSGKKDDTSAFWQTTIRVAHVPESRYLIPD